MNETIVIGTRTASDSAKRMGELTENYSLLLQEPAMLFLHHQMFRRGLETDVAIGEVMRDVRGLAEEVIQSLQDYLINNYDRCDEITTAHFDRVAKNAKGGGWE